MRVEFLELSGRLIPGGITAPESPNRVVLSNLTCGASESAACDDVALKYVAHGVEVYRYGGKAYAVAAGQFLIVPPKTAGDVEISRSTGEHAKGLCVTLDSTNLHGACLDVPMIFPAQCSDLGKMLASFHSRIANDPRQRTSSARALVERAHHEFEPLLEETSRHLTGIEAARPATRYELLRKLNSARSYLHSIEHRAVSLGELAKEAGISQFHLLRNFRSCFGLPPSAYHRRIRLNAGKRAIERKEMSCSEAAHRFGFADSSSFSHAYRRTFGIAPTECPLSSQS